MSRIAPLEPPYAPELQSHFDQIMGPGVPPLVLFRTVAVSERAWLKFRSGSLLDNGPLSLREREIVIDRVCARTGCEYEWGVHVAAFADRAHLSTDEVAATADLSSRSGPWSEAEAALIAAVDALEARATLSQAEFDRLEAHYDPPQVLEVLLLAGFYRTVAYLANGLDLPLEAGAARFNPSPATGQ
jgi:alkylhydroperoxidase family enzyme